VGRWREARTELTVCMNLRPDFPWPLVLSGFAASEQGFRFSSPSEYDQALADLDQALAHRHLDAQARYVGLVNRGVVFIRQQEWKKAFADLHQAIKVNEAAFQAHVNLAQAFYGAGRRADALTAITRAIERAVDRPELYVVRAQIRLNRKDQAAAGAAFTDLDPKGAAAARADYEKAVELWKDSKSQRRAETRSHHAPRDATSRVVITLRVLRLPV
jgi:tetratricopeptide (TPR) repeat protein